MRTKTLLLTAAVVAVSAIASQAQVYSVNAVGYVNKTLKPGYNLIGNPLNGTNNLLSTIIPTAPDASAVYRWDNTLQTFKEGDVYFDGMGWLDGGFNPSATVINPGEGFFFQNNSGADVTITFVGEVPQGTLTNSIGGNYGFYSSVVPQAAALSSMGFPVIESMGYNAWDVVAQGYAQGYFVAGGEWYDSNFTPGAPVPTVGDAFLLSNPGASFNWVRTFNVNN